MEAFTHHCSWWKSSQTKLSAQLLPFSQKCRSVLLSPRDSHPPGTRLQVKNTSFYSVLCHLGSSFWNITSPFHCWVRWRVKEGERLYGSFQSHSLSPSISLDAPRTQLPFWAASAHCQVMLSITDSLSSHFCCNSPVHGKSHVLKAHTVFAKEVTSVWQPRDVLSVLCRVSLKVLSGII